MTEYKFYLTDDKFNGSDLIRAYFYAFNESKVWSITMDGSEFKKFKMVPKEEGEEGEIFFEVTSRIARGFFQAMAEGLAHAGYVAEVDNKQRITSEALANERKEQLEKLQKENKDLINKVLDKL